MEARKSALCEALDLKRWEAYLAPRHQRLEETLESYLPSPLETPPAVLHEAMRYAVLGGGKRLRPLLCIAGAECCGGQMEKVLPTACAIEFIHSFSLIHDDLPALDNDLLRRGRPTCHVQFGEALALLAGDALFASAFELIALQTQLSPPERVVQVLQLIARASGTHGMVGGQVEDILSEGKEVSPATLEYIHTHKTGALIQAAVMAGAILAGGEESSLQALARYGAAFGHAFQIIDDILNEVGSEAKLGKSVGSDRQRMKATYPRLLGLEASWQAAEQKTQEALQALQPFEERADPLRWIALSVLCQELE